MVTVLDQLVKSKASIDVCNTAVSDFNIQNDSDFSLRLRSVNGQGLMGTTDVRWNRINIVVEEARVIELKYGVVDFSGGKLISYSFG